MEVEFSSVKDAYQYAANLPVTVGTVTYGDGEVEYLGYVGDHCIGYFEDEQSAQIEAAKFDRRQLVKVLDS